jgi:hypothetical protein
MTIAQQAILVAGPKAEAFLERFCEHKVALVNVDNGHRARQFGASRGQEEE